MERSDSPPRHTPRLPASAALVVFIAALALALFSLGAAAQAPGFDAFVGTRWNFGTGDRSTWIAPAVTGISGLSAARLEELTYDPNALAIDPSSGDLWLQATGTSSGKLFESKSATGENLGSLWVDDFPGIVGSLHVYGHWLIGHAWEADGSPIGTYHAWLFAVRKDGARAGALHTLDTGLGVTCTALAGDFLFAADRYGELARFSIRSRGEESIELPPGIAGLSFDGATLWVAGSDQGFTLLAVHDPLEPGFSSAGLTDWTSFWRGEYYADAVASGGAGGTVVVGLDGVMSIPRDGGLRFEPLPDSRYARGAAAVSIAGVIYLALTNPPAVAVFDASLTPLGEIPLPSDPILLAAR